MTEMFGEAWSPMSVPDLAPDDDDELCDRSKGQGFSFLSFSLALAVCECGLRLMVT